MNLKDINMLFVSGFVVFIWICFVIFFLILCYIVYVKFLFNKLFLIVNVYLIKILVVVCYFFKWK